MSMRIHPIVGPVACVVVAAACAPAAEETAVPEVVEEAAQEVAAMTPLLANPSEVVITFAQVGNGETCDATYEVNGVASDQVTLHKQHTASNPNEGVWKFQSDYYDMAWVILENNGLDKCLDDIDNFPAKDARGFEIKSGGTSQTVRNDANCVSNTTYTYKVRAKKSGGDYCGADPKVRILD